MKRVAQRGAVLVMTLIMLAVMTLLAVSSTRDSLMQTRVLAKGLDQSAGAARISSMRSLAIMAAVLRCRVSLEWRRVRPCRVATPSMPTLISKAVTKTSTRVKPVDCDGRGIGFDGCGMGVVACFPD